MADLSLGYDGAMRVAVLSLVLIAVASCASKPLSVPGRDAGMDAADDAPFDALPDGLPTCGVDAGWAIVSGGTICPAPPADHARCMIECRAIWLGGGDVAPVPLAECLVKSDDFVKAHCAPSCASPGCQ